MADHNISALIDTAEALAAKMDAMRQAQRAFAAFSQEQVDLAAQIAEETGASYLHLLPSEDLIACLLWQGSSVPTTIFVDETGALIGKGYLGSRDAAAWRSIIEEKLEAVSAGEDAK